MPSIQEAVQFNPVNIPSNIWENIKFVENQHYKMGIGLSPTIEKYPPAIFMIATKTQEAEYTFQDSGGYDSDNYVSNTSFGVDAHLEGDPTLVSTFIDLFDQIYTITKTLNPQKHGTIKPKITNVSMYMKKSVSKQWIPTIQCIIPSFNVWEIAVSLTPLIGGEANCYITINTPDNIGVFNSCVFDFEGMEYWAIYTTGTEEQSMLCAFIEFVNISIQYLKQLYSISYINTDPACFMKNYKQIKGHIF